MSTSDFAKWILVVVMIVIAYFSGRDDPGVWP